MSVWLEEEVTFQKRSSRFGGTFSVVSRILITGATGYVGGRLVKDLLGQNHELRVLVRDPKKVSSQDWQKEVEVVVGSVTDKNAVMQAMENVEIAYYLLHSINSSTQFDLIEKEMAENFAEAAKNAGIKQIIYLGGIANDNRKSTHLESRATTGRILANSGIPVIELRAGIIIGSGSASFEMLRHLTHRLPIMTTPKWVKNRTQPISIRDVLYYLTACSKLKSPITGIFDIGGSEILTYEEMMQTFARISGLRKRIIVKVPVLTPSLSSLWIGFVTPVPTSLARPLVESLISEVVVDPEKSISQLIPPPGGGLSSVQQSIELALEKVWNNEIETRWSDATSFTAPWQRAQGDPTWAGAAEFHDVRTRLTQISTDQLWAAVERIGGETGWYGSDWLWYLRGLLDRMIGGVGLRRGRRDPLKLRVGDSLDFWRVEEIEPGRRLRLYAEMILPGKAWLEFELHPEADGVRITQTATFQPRGLGGQLYWRTIAPLHSLLFPTMLRNLCKSADKS